VSRNLLNYPLARSARTKLRWLRAKPSRRWQANLPLEDKIQIWFPARMRRTDCRLLTGFDIAVLLHLLRAAQLPKAKRKSLRISFATAALLLKQLKVTCCTRERDRLFDALDLLSVIKIRHKEWHIPSGKVRKVLPPPVKQWCRDRHCIEIEIDPAWVALIDQGFFTNIKLPLPLDATVQNLILRICAFDRKAEQQWDCSDLARKAGISRVNRRKRLRAALAEAAEWFHEQGIAVTVEHAKHAVHLTIKWPRGGKKTDEPETYPEVEAWEAEFFARQAAVYAATGRYEEPKKWRQEDDDDAIYDPYADM
jgi:hypothetical protein